ncbi:MAG TPA: N-acetyl-gamma-glutamyl-phosphate reductase, partial [Candidatus Binataceae bacterium]|nr:N-acetyl-gamma-glutamyl-phosphate reductase [Candidatus Binataceae bacterium]
MASHDRVKVAVLGASGYSGIEAVRLLAGHPFVELNVLTSEHYAGREVAEVYRHLAGIDLPPFEELRADLLSGRAEVVISCLPERVGAKIITDLISAGIKVIDVSADFRLKDAATYRQTYGVEHPAPKLLDQTVYGLSEFNRRELREAHLVANPGCYPTGALLGILPLIRRDLIDPSSIVVDAKSGTTGARRQAAVEQLFAEVNENFRAYKVGNHRHTPEMEQEIGFALGREVAIMFVPHLLPVTRGIL